MDIFGLTGDLSYLLDIIVLLLKIMTSGSSAGRLFSMIQTTLELTDKVQALYAFVVTGNEGGKWYIDLKPSRITIGKGNPPSRADATVTMDSKYFIDMYNGKLKPATAFMTGKLKITGNLPKTLKLEKLMKSLKSKL